MPTVGRNSVEFVFTATDRVTPTVERLKAELKLFGPAGEVLVDLSNRSDAAVRRLDVGVTQLTRSVRSLTLPLVGELAPAFGTVAAQATAVVTSSAALATGLTAVALAASGLAGIVGGQLIGVWQRWRQEIEEFNRAQRSVDVDVITRGLQKEREEVSKLTDEIEDLRQELERLRSQGTAVPLGEFNAGGGGLGNTSALERDLEERIRRLTGLTQRIDAFRVGRQSSDFARAENELPIGSTESSDAAGLETRRRIADVRRQIIEVGILDPIERAFAAALRQADAALLGGNTGESGELARRLRELAARSRAEAIRLRSIDFQGRPIEGIEEVGRFESFTDRSVTEADVARLQRGLFAADARSAVGREPAPEPGIDEVGRFEAGGLASSSRMR
jgi:hypothetical protein